MCSKRHSAALLLPLALMSGGVAGPVSAQSRAIEASGSMSLEEAFAAAYLGNPSLRADREGLKILDEDVAAARSAGRPVVQGEATVTRAELDVQGTGYIVGARLTQPLFRGFRVTNNVRAARTNVTAGRESLRQNENDLFHDVAEQYSAVLRDRDVLKLNEALIASVTTIRDAETRRLAVGERTRTDVSQAEARLAAAVASLARAHQRLAASEARFRALVGESPVALAPLPVFPGLPESLDTAIDIALQSSPRIRQKKLEAQVAHYQVDAAKGALAPQLDFVASVNRRDEIVQILGRKVNQDFATLQAVLTVPLFQGGSEYAAIRRAKHTETVRSIEIEEETRAVYADVSVAWDGLVAARKASAALAAAVKANEDAVSGVKREALSGSRTTLDILDAEAELRDARISYRSAQHDEYVAQFSLLAALGTATAQDLHLDIPRYDPDEHYRAAAGLWIGVKP